MAISLINIGFGNMISANRMIAMVSPESAPIKRLVSDAKDAGKVIDATYGRKTRAVIFMDSGQIILTSVQPETVSARIQGKPCLLYTSPSPRDLSTGRMPYSA